MFGGYARRPSTPICSQPAATNPPAGTEWFAAALFAVLHFSLLSLPYLFMVGLLLGWAKWKTGSLYPSILVHFLHNLIVLEFF